MTAAPVAPEPPQEMSRALLADEEHPSVATSPEAAQETNGPAAANWTTGFHGWRQERAAQRTRRCTVDECLALHPGTERAEMTLDVYNMLYLSDLWSQAFFYSLYIMFTKTGLYVLLLCTFKKSLIVIIAKHADVDLSIQIAQLFLLPVAIVMQEELLTSFFVFSHLRGYSPAIQKRHPGATRWKFFASQGARFVDGAIFLFLNFSVMLSQEEDVLGLLLNFAALMFLSEIDNIALTVCLQGFWSQELQDSAQDVVEMKFAYKKTKANRRIQTIFVLVTMAIFGTLWLFVHYAS